MKRGRRQFIAFLAASSGLALIALLMGAQSVRADVLQYDTPTPVIGPTFGPTPVPEPGKTPAPQNTTTTTIIQHRLLFPAETITESLIKVFTKGFDGVDLANESAKWGQVMGALFQPPANGDYAKKAQSSWPVAVALAPALFVLRIAFYNWRRLTGDDDSAARAAGDIVTALLLAVMCGWFLDLVVRMGWGITGAVVGETTSLAVDFLRGLSFTEYLGNVATVTALGIFAPIFSIAMTIGGIMGLAGVLLSFLVAQGALYVLAILGPAVMIASVIPELRFMRSFWIKVVVMIALLPLLAGGIFKATVAGTNLLTGGGLSLGIIIGPLIRVLWLWAAAGAMLSVVGVLGRFTITTTADAASKVFGAVKGIATTAALAATGVGIGAAGGVAAGGVGAGGASAASAAGGSGVTGASAASLTSEQKAQGFLDNANTHLGSAQNWNYGGMMADAFGQRQVGQFARSMASQHTLAARQAELGLMMERFGTGAPGSAPEKTDDIGFEADAGTRARLLQGYGSDDPEKFKDAFEGLSPFLGSKSISANSLAQQRPEEFGKLALAYQNQRDAIDSLEDLADKAKVSKDIFNENNSWS